MVAYGIILGLLVLSPFLLLASTSAFAVSSKCRNRAVAALLGGIAGGLTFFASTFGLAVLLTGWPNDDNPQYWWDLPAALATVSLILSPIPATVGWFSAARVKRARPSNHEGVG